MRVYLLVLLCWVASLTIMAQIPPGYYDPAQGLSGIPLQTALHAIIDDHTSVAYGNLYNYFIVTDIRPDSTVWDMYSDIPGGTPPYVYHYVSADECGGYTAEGDCFNREHSWPKSWFGGEIMPMYSDMFHLYPTDGWVNNKRNNYPYGEVGSASWTSLNGSKLGNCTWPGYSGTVFEPIDAYKGDFARSYFYMSVRYYGEDAIWPGSDMTNGSQLKPWALSMMLQWSQDDTVSQKEIDRNNAIYEVQGNRNPFIDRPQYAMDIWGPGAGILSIENNAIHVYPNPVHGHCTLVIPKNLLSSNCDIQIISTTGTIVFSKKEIIGNKLDLDLTNLPAGVYFLEIIQDNNRLPYTSRIIIL